MPAPTVYTELDLATYMQNGVLGATGVELHLLSLQDYQEAVNEVSAVLGAIGAVTDIARLRALARREAWRLAMQTAAGEHAAEDNGASHSRQQIYDHCVTMFDRAAREYTLLGPVPDDDGSTLAASAASYAVPNKAVW